MQAALRGETYVSQQTSQTRSGINPGDTKKPSGWQGTPMAFPRIIPHLTTAANTGALTIPIGAAYPLAEVAAAHVDHGPRTGRILLTIPD